MLRIVLEDDPAFGYTFQSVPEELVEGYSANFTAQTGISSQAAYYKYSGGEWDTLTINTVHYAGLDDGISDPEEASAKMVAELRRLQAMAFPRPVAQRLPSQKLIAIGIPPMALLIWGSFIVLRGRVTNVNISWLRPFLPGTATPKHCTIAVTFQPIMAFYPDFYDVQDARFRGSVVTAGALLGEGASRIITDKARASERAGLSAYFSSLQNSLRSNDITREEYNEGIEAQRERAQSLGVNIPSAQ
jgi:hypothetical protein